MFALSIVGPEEQFAHRGKGMGLEKDFQSFEFKSTYFNYWFSF